MKKGFTLIEIMVTISLITIITFMSFSTINTSKLTRNKEIRAKYPQVLDALDKFADEISQSDDEDNPFKIEEAEAISKFHSEIIDYLNNIEANHPSNLCGEDYDYTNCNFKEQTHNLLTLNGIKFYYPNKRYNFTFTNEDGDEESENFFIVFADLNANAKENIPRTIFYKLDNENNIDRDSLPMVYPFAILPTGNAIPLGEAELNPNILEYKIGTYENQGNNTVIKYSGGYSYHRAKNAMYGDYQFDKNNPHTYNDILRNHVIIKDFYQHATPNYVNNRNQRCPDDCKIIFNKKPININKIL